MLDDCELSTEFHPQMLNGDVKRGDDSRRGKNVETTKAKMGTLWRIPLIASHAGGAVTPYPPMLGCRVLNEGKKIKEGNVRCQEDVKKKEKNWAPVPAHFLYNAYLFCIALSKKKLCLERLS